jgi:hypothetical protein
MYRLAVVGVMMIAVWARLWMITQVPLAMNWDEITFGYNAYSLLKTGRDEYGLRLPLEFKSIGDYKLPVFIYSLVPSIFLFGQGDLAIRVVPAIAGVIGVFGFLYSATLVSGNKWIGIWSALSLSVSPWHLQFTRAGADVAVSSMLVILGIALVLRRHGGWGGIMLALSVYTYYSERFFVPMLIGLLLAYYWNERHVVYRTMLVGLLFIAPLVPTLLSSGQQYKVGITTVFGLQPQDESQLGYWSRLVVSRITNHLSPNFLFIQGPEDNRQRIEGMGMMYLSDLVWLGLGVLAIKKFGWRKTGWWIFAWIVLASLPAAITRGETSARRAFNMIYPLSVLVGMGVWHGVKTKPKMMIGLLPVVVWGLCFYGLSYYKYTPARTYLGAGGWQFGYRQLVQEVEQIKDKYVKVVVDTSYQGPYIYFLWYGKYPPEKYQPQAKLEFPIENGLGEGPGYDKYEFRSIYWPADRGQTGKVLFAGPPERLPDKDIDPKQAKIIKRIYFKDTEMWRLVEVN